MLRVAVRCDCDIGSSREDIVHTWFISICGGLLKYSTQLCLESKNEHFIIYTDSGTLLKSFFFSVILSFTWKKSSLCCGHFEFGMKQMRIKLCYIKQRVFNYIAPFVLFHNQHDFFALLPDYTHLLAGTSPAMRSGFVCFYCLARTQMYSRLVNFNKISLSCQESIWPVKSLTISKERRQHKEHIDHSS